MTDEREAAAPGGGSDGLWRWLVGGLVAGAVVLGLLVAAYAVGHSRGEDAARATSPATTEPVATATSPTTTTAPPTATTPPWTHGPTAAPTGCPAPPDSRSTSAWSSTTPSPRSS